MSLSEELNLYLHDGKRPPDEEQGRRREDRKSESVGGGSRRRQQEPQEPQAPPLPGSIPSAEETNTAPGVVHSQSVIMTEDVKAIVREGDDAWEKFEHYASLLSGLTIKLSDVPFPRIDGGLDSETFRRWALRWHPDKFVQAFGSKLEKEERSAILARVTSTFQEMSQGR